jgi:hypothetical protein
MPEDSTTTTTTSPPTGVQPGETVTPPEPERREPPDENLVGEAKRKQRAAEKEAAQLRERLEALEDKDRTETERAQKRAEAAEKEAKELRERTEKLEKGGWVRAAAAKANFHDPDDAVVRADLSDIDSEGAAQQFVKNLAKDKKHLVKDESPPPGIGQVLKNGEKPETTPQNAAQQAEVERATAMAAELKRLTESSWMQ